MYINDITVNGNQNPQPIEGWNQNPTENLGKKADATCVNFSTASQRLSNVYGLVCLLLISRWMVSWGRRMYR